MYSYSLRTTSGRTGVWTFLVLLNAGGHDKALHLRSVRITPYATASTSSNSPLKLVRVSSTSGGSTAAAADIVKFNTTHPDPVGVIITGNPTIITRGPEVTQFAPVNQRDTDAVANPNVQEFTLDDFNRIRLGAGEGIAIVQDSGGNANQHYPMTVKWDEQFD